MKPHSITGRIAQALARTAPPGTPLDVDWRAVADDFVIALAGQVTLLAKEDYDRITLELRALRQELRAFGVEVRHD